MDQQDLERRELLQKYVLGLTDREQTERIQTILRDDPASRKDLAYLREQLSSYADSHNIVKPLSNRPLRGQEDFDDLDHEMIMAMTERNHSLIIWRYALGAACLLLLFLCGYLFRQNQTNRAELVVEKARHAQDDESHQLRIKDLKEDATVDWAGLHTEDHPTAVGNILVHHLDNEQTALLDFSHLQTPEEGFAYYLFAKEADEDKPGLMLTSDRLAELFPISLPTKTLRLYLWRKNEQPSAPLPAEDLVAELDLKLQE